MSLALAKASRQILKAAVCAASQVDGPPLSPRRNAGFLAFIFTRLKSIGHDIQAWSFCSAQRFPVSVFGKTSRFPGSQHQDIGSGSCDDKVKTTINKVKTTKTVIMGHNELFHNSSSLAAARQD